MAYTSDDDVFETFSVLSKVVILVPVIVVIIALVYKFNKQDQRSPLRSSSFEGQAKPTIYNQTTSGKINIDLKGPLICNGKIDDLIVNAFIKDKKIKVILDQKTKKENMIINGDCYYYWQEGQYTGEKICGLSSFMSLAETMINLGGPNLNLITSQLTKLGLDQKIATNEAKITELVKSCKKGNIDTKIFEVPGNILFKNKK